MLRSDVTVDEFTTPEPVTATEEMTIDDLRRLMAEHGIRHLPIVRGERVVGVISDRDVRLVAGLTSDEKRLVRASDIMATEPLVVSATTRLDEVAYAMSERKVGSAIVTEPDGKLLGIFTATDALNALIEVVRGDGTAS